MLLLSYWCWFNVNNCCDFLFVQIKIVLFVKLATCLFVCFFNNKTQIILIEWLHLMSELFTFVLQHSDVVLEANLILGQRKFNWSSGWKFL